MSQPNVVAVLPGTFDPVTLGHLDIIERAAGLCDSLIVAVASEGRKFLFSVEERIALIERAIQGTAFETRTAVKSFSGLLVDAVRGWNGTLLVRGVRGPSDVDYEMTMAHANRDLAPELETVFLPSTSTLHAVSASLVREVSSLGGDVSSWVPRHVVKELKKRNRN